MIGSDPSREAPPAVSQRKARPRRGIKVEIEGIAAVKLGGDGFRWDDAYSSLFSMRPAAFIATYVGVYLTLNTLFALLYMVQPGSVTEARPGSFRDHFFFSVETFATVGYGVMSPHTLYGHIVTSAEILTGVFFTAGLAGLIFSRFSRPRARMLFSDVCIVSLYRGAPALMLRVASRRNRAMSEVSARLTLLHKEGTDKTFSRRFVDLPLVRSSAPLIGLSWTLAHLITPESPLANLASMIADDPNLTLIASLNGFDETIAATVSARKIYASGDIRFDHTFVDIIGLTADGRISLDLTRIHEVEPLPTAAGGFGVP
jgi:inward rectifier potassium channel